MTEADLAESPDPLSATRASRWVWVGVGLVVIMVIFWTWIFSGAPRKLNPDRIADREWVESAVETCSATMDRVDGRAASADEQDLDTRADAIDANSDDLEAMLAALADPLPADADDQAVIEPWLADWAQLIKDRRQYADAVRVNPEARFLTIEKFNDPLDRVVKTFAEINDMHICGPAGDVG